MTSCSEMPSSFACSGICLSTSGVRRQKCAIQMDGEELLPFRKLELIDRRHGLNAGIGNKDIEPAKGLDRFGDAGLSLRFIGNIDGDTDCTLGTAELGRNCISAFLVEVSDHDSGAFSGK